MKSEKRIIFKLKTLSFLALLLLGVLFVPSKGANARKVDRQCELADPVLLAKCGDIELWGEKNYAFTIPCDRVTVVEIEVRNTGDHYQLFHYDNDIKITGSKAVTDHLWLGTVHPQWDFHLKPHETGMMQISLEVMNKDGLKDKKKQKVEITIPCTVREAEDEGFFAKEAKEQKVTVGAVFRTISQKSLTSGKNCKVSISGYLKDGAGKPIPNANVLITSGWASFNSVFTDSKGFYSVKVMPYYSKYRGMYSEYAITTRVDGYMSKTVVVKPAKKAIKKNIKLRKRNAKLSYKQTKVMDLGIQAYDLDASKDGSVIATVPFHTMLPKAETEGKRKLVVVTQTGKVLFEKELPSETPYVDVSDDGEYILVTSEFAGDRASNAVIYDKKGKELYRTPDEMPCLNEFTEEYMRDKTEESYCARLSPDNSLLAYSSTGGQFWMIDWKKNKVIWNVKVDGQIRTIDFSDDGYVYLTCGTGYAICYKTETGELSWKAFIQGWGTESVVAGDLFVTTTKSDGYALIALDRKTGKKVWDYPVDCRGTGLAVSPDGTKLWWGNDKGGDYSPVNSAIFDLKTGKLLKVFSVCGKYAGMAAKWSADGKRILVKDGGRFAVYDTKTGETLFEKEVVPDATSDSLCFSLYASDDLKYVVAGFNTDKNFRFGGSLFFFKQE
ncbi:MAG: PQQ-binding-like beta-propeller repeat protein [Lachnospiraceae bacterium]|nr:PQQ-binding-like beta-propeller repeat protein [Lachnospiraceae bacterium]